MEIPDYAVVVDRKGIEGKKLSFVRGLAAANLQDLSEPRDYDWAMENLILPKMRSGYIEDGKTSRFDDRKLRYHSLRQSGDKLEISLGPTYFNAFKADMQRDEAANSMLQWMGKNKFNDEYAFFSRPFAVTVLPITADGSIFIGQRTNNEYGGFLHGVAGFVDFRDPEKVDLVEDILRELREELGLQQDQLADAPKAVGISYHPNTGETDVSFIVKAKIGDKYIESGEWKNKASEREHRDMIKIASMEDVKRLLREGKIPNSDSQTKLMYSTRHALENLVSGDIR